MEGRKESLQLQLVLHANSYDIGLQHLLMVAVASPYANSLVQLDSKIHSLIATGDCNDLASFPGHSLFQSDCLQ